jgi:hypothetical protein
MQHLESAVPPIAHPSRARSIRVLAAAGLCLAGPAVSFTGVLTAGLSGTAAAVTFPPGYGVTMAATAAATTLAAVLAALIARRDALVMIPAVLGLWFTVGVGAGIAGIELSHPGLAHWGIVIIAASITGTVAGMIQAARQRRAHKPHRQPATPEHRASLKDQRPPGKPGRSKRKLLRSPPDRYSAVAGQDVRTGTSVESARSADDHEIP